MSTIKPSLQQVVVIIPTYNEVANIGQMIEYLNTKTIPALDKKWDMKILVVDGNSPDGTGKIVEEKSKKYKNTFLLSETSKDGLGAAYLKGFKYAIDELKADFVFEFDGDFQHPPETIPVMLRALDEGYDYVIGSRKVKGGSNPKGWGFKRVFLSEVGGFTARFIMFFPFKNFFKVTDPTTGLKATRVKGFVDKMDLDWTGSRLLSRSFGYKLQLLFETLKMGAKYKEIPLEFHVRNAGESKIETKTAKDILLVALKLRWRDELTQKFIKFAIVGGIGFIVNIVGGRIFKNLLGPVILSVSLLNGVANALAAELSIISNFTWNNLWTFSKEKITGSNKIIPKFLAFNASSAITGIAIPSLVISLLTTFFGDYFLLYQFIAIFALTIPLNWIVYNKIIWKKNI